MKQAISPVIAGIIIAVVLAAAVWYGYKAANPQKAPAGLTRMDSMTRDNAADAMRPPADAQGGAPDRSGAARSGR